MSSESEKLYVDTFTFEDGHNEASIDYMRSLPLADAKTSKEMLDKYQIYINSLPIEPVIISERKRIKR